MANHRKPNRQPNRRSRRYSSAMERMDSEQSAGRLDILALGMLDRVGRMISNQVGIPVLYDAIRPQVAEIVGELVPREPMDIPPEVIQAQAQLLGFDTGYVELVEGYYPDQGYPDQAYMEYEEQYDPQPPPRRVIRRKGKAKKVSNKQDRQDRQSQARQATRDCEIVDAEFVDIPDNPDTN